MGEQMKLGVLCSGGKDSLYACWRAMQKEEVACLITVVSRNEESYMFHTPNIRRTRMQAKAARLPLVEVETAGEKEAELSELREAIELARDGYGIEGVVTGAVLSVYQASRIQQICHELGLWCFNPLWHTDQEAYMNDLIASGFRVIVSGVSSYPFDESWLGRVIDREALEELKRYAAQYQITLTGEGGEIETFVVDAPFFTQKIAITAATSTYANYRGIYHIEEAELVDK
jgi:diphthine-ammonia ligase